MCKICGNNTVKKNIGKLLYDFCPVCGFLSKDERYILDSKSEFERYLKHDNDDNENYYNYQEKFYFESKEYLGDTNLDFGCGYGKVLVNILNKNGYETIGYDLYFHPDVKYEKHLYDAIILEEVIEHLKDPKEVLNNLINLLNTNGKIIIRTQFTPLEVFDINWWYLRDTTHISFFNYETFEYLCKVFPLKIIYCNDKDLIILQREE